MDSVIDKVERRLLERLPEPIHKGLAVRKEENNDEQIDHFLKNRLPRRNINEIELELQKRFPLAKERQVYKKRIRKQGCPRKKYLSNTKKRDLGLFYISKKGLLYKDLLPLHQLWNQYIRDLLDFQDSRLCSTSNEEISNLLMKADFHGAFLEVRKSLCPNLVGISGLVVLETRNIFKLLGKDNITRSVAKQTCEFTMKVSSYLITFLGKNLLMRAADRSNKKLRQIKYVEL